MSTALIIAIVVIALILIAVFAFILPRARHRAEVRARERELEQRRERVVDEHRTQAEERSRRAEIAEQQAREAEQEARRERADAELHQQRAQRHEQGMADHELIEDHERDRFAETSASHDATRDDAGDERQRESMAAEQPRHEAAPPATTGGATGQGSEYEQGREDEAREREGGLAGRFKRTEDEPADRPSGSRPA
jgi:FtsZ-interacting cell division protein ZipA